MKAQDKREIVCTGCNKTLTLWTRLGNKGKGNASKHGGGWRKLDNGMYICTECGKLFLGELIVGITKLPSKGHNITIARSARNNIPL